MVDITSEARLRAHLHTLNDCNQRGGRLLSLVDLIEAGTVDLDLAAYLAAVMRRGGSLLVGARPGGAGKTAVMVALLNFLPNAVVLQPIEGPVVLRRGLVDTAYGKTCFLAHEIGAGFYYAYLWGDQAKAFFKLGGHGHIIASNLHADTLIEAQSQLIDENDVAAEDLRAVKLKLFLRLGRGPDLHMRRWVNTVYESDGHQDRLMWQLADRNRFARLSDSTFVTPDAERICRAFLETLIARGERTLEEVRVAVTHECSMIHPISA